MIKLEKKKRENVYIYFIFIESKNYLYIFLFRENGLVLIFFIIDRNIFLRIK